MPQQTRSPLSRWKESQIASPSDSKYRLEASRSAFIPTTPPVIIDLKKASAYLVYSPRKLRDLIAARRVKHARIGAKIVIKREWLDAFLA